MDDRGRGRTGGRRAQLPDPKSTLALQADKKASFGTIIKVMDALKLAGVRNLPAFTREEK
jgi:Biopolymer transport protein